MCFWLKCCSRITLGVTPGALLWALPQGVATGSSTSCLCLGLSLPAGLLPVRSGLGSPLVTVLHGDMRNQDVYGPCPPADSPTDSFWKRGFSADGSSGLLAPAVSSETPLTLHAGQPCPGRSLGHLVHPACCGGHGPPVAAEPEPQPAGLRCAASRDPRWVSEMWHQKGRKRSR